MVEKYFYEIEICRTLPESFVGDKVEPVFSVFCALKHKMFIQNVPIQSFGKVSKTEKSATQSGKSLNGKSTVPIYTGSGSSIFILCRIVDTTNFQNVAEFI